MTRDEFIDGFMKRSNIDPAMRTDEGFFLGKYERIALPCHCGEPECDGWAMVPKDAESIDLHNRLYGHQRGEE
ncbi:MAG TPA: hypothetical protein VG328_17950 [Stellaceae bacterium]|jgi:hypothetical protein|nr:hypothetical protein [Stellaceae bacterium]